MRQSGAPRAAIHPHSMIDAVENKAFPRKNHTGQVQQSAKPLFVPLKPVSPRNLLMVELLVTPLCTDFFIHAFPIPSAPIQGLLSHQFPHRTRGGDLGDAHPSKRTDWSPQQEAIVLVPA